MAVPPPFPAVPSVDAKAALRSRLRAARLAFANPEAAQALRRQLDPLAGDGPFAGYVAHRGEPDILPLLIDAHRRGHPIALPRMLPERAMIFVDWNPATPLEAGPLGIAQPAPGAPIVPATLLVPLLGFDRRGTRLGQGGGHYDRWCAAHPGVRRIGIAWSVQEVDALPVDPWDQRLDAIVTEREWITI